MTDTEEYLRNMIAACTVAQLEQLALAVGAPEPTADAIAKTRASQLSEIQEAGKIRHMRSVLAARYEALRETGGRCGLCGASSRNGATLHVDHIKPVSRYPELAADPNNMQVLCADCNAGKGNVYEDDWR